jgi:hypothetical protein
MADHPRQGRRSYYSAVVPNNSNLRLNWIFLLSLGKGVLVY